jgi:uncharacterized membrane protein
VRDESDRRFPILSPGTRLLVCAAIGAGVAVGVGAVSPWQLAVLSGWDVALAIFLASVWMGVGRLDSDTTRSLAITEDLSHLAAEVLLTAASVVNLAVVGSALIEATDRDVVVATLINGACVLSVALSWAVLHTGYAMRYARLHYQGGGGVDFQDGPPDYRDFAYLAFTIGMTYQVSDTPLTTRTMRRTAFSHMLLSYVFGAVILASVINVVAGLFRR